MKLRYFSQCSSLRELNHFVETFTQDSNNDNNNLYEDQYLQKVQQHRSHISICHLNTQEIKK